MTLRESVLVAIALVLLAGIITYNVFTLSSPEEEGSSAPALTSFSATPAESETESMLREGAAETILSATGTSEKININTAGLHELTRLSGIGEVKGQAIIDYRTQNGPFSSVDDLLSVNGIGEKTLEKIRNEITV